MSARDPRDVAFGQALGVIAIIVIVYVLVMKAATMGIIP